MLNKILSPLPPEDLKHAELQSMLHMSPLNRMLQESCLQDNPSHVANPHPTPQLLTVDALIKIKQSLRITMQQQQQKEAQELQVGSFFIHKHTMTSSTSWTSFIFQWEFTSLKKNFTWHEEYLLVLTYSSYSNFLTLYLRSRSNSLLTSNWVPP